jgi:hypothetical protein
MNVDDVDERRGANLESVERLFVDRRINADRRFVVPEPGHDEQVRDGPRGRREDVSEPNR